ncbi:acyloxyacyl hydrolase [candidate division KSB1 bacterium]|nr:acyloxyacyl hydrolase [candidate division KSB1 bacterium]NIR68972.1 acyloxyacyl hydrolase [candidate division KSB1 bacterium]NIS22594.1 acyloxyacyl hydrolase [candidate division KSB1 bacterium]NIT69454.1 acyloxyacyl hydrolase [candidate division KSB1 bacterium]NIU23109.1 acyloxyacyl hydrolase [candidate division KSB1 bacterium]
MLARILALLLSCLPVCAFSQNGAYSRQNDLNLTRDSQKVSVWSGVSPDSPDGGFLGKTKDKMFVILGVRYGKVVAAGRRMALEYTFDAFPVAEVIDRNSKDSVYGFGLSPVGLKWYVLQVSRFKLFTNGSGGFLTFVEDVPDPDARKFNFTFEFGGGIEVFTNSRVGIALGYRYHHLSNANTEKVNPGLDANIFYIGISRFF